MKTHFRFRLSSLFLGAIVVGYLIALSATWSTRSVLIGAALSFVAAISTVLLSWSCGRKLWRVTLWTVFIAHFAYIASIGPAAWLVATINRPNVRSPLAKRLFMKAYSPVSDVLISGPYSLQSAGFAYVDWWLPRDAVIRKHEGVGIIIRHKGHGETYLCVRSEALK